MTDSKKSVDWFVKAMNLDCAGMERVTGVFDTPVLEPAKNVHLERLIGFHKALSFRGKKEGVGVHFFIDDVQFERVWNQPKRYVNVLKGFECVAAPDFSMFLEMPRAMIAWNHYRKMAVAQFWQNHGVNVVPTLNWCSRDSFAFCFDGVPKESIAAVTALGSCGDDDARNRWECGMTAALEKLDPETVIFYGDKIDFDFGKRTVLFFEAEHLKKMRERKSDGRTRFIVDNVGLVIDVAKKLGIGPDLWEDFKQEVILKSIQCKDGYDPKKGEMRNWVVGFAKMVGMNFRRKEKRNEREKEIWRDHMARIAEIDCDDWGE